jgi:hypothetical protein
MLCGEKNFFALKYLYEHLSCMALLKSNFNRSNGFCEDIAVHSGVKRIAVKRRLAHSNILGFFLQEGAEIGSGSVWILKEEDLI